MEDCSAEGTLAEYNVSLHIGALFIIMAVSLTGTLLPILIQRASLLGKVNSSNTPLTDTSSLTRH
jgi:hypothetical protein